MGPLLTREQIRQVDALAVSELGIPGIVLMENAGRNAAGHIRERIKRAQAQRAVIFCGTGNNGGDGFVIARHLSNAGVPVSVHLFGEADRLSPDAAVNHGIIQAMGLQVASIRCEADAESAVSAIQPSDAVVDALLGTGSSGPVRSPLDKLIGGMNETRKALAVAIDVPSGLDCDTGRPANAAFQADLTITFVAAKTGFAEAEAYSYVGEVMVCDIGAPPELIQRVSA